MKTYYKDLLRRTREMDINILDAAVANEIDCVFEIMLSDENFELACALIKDVYLKYEYISLSDATYALKKLVEDEGKAISTITKRELSEAAL